MCKDQDAAVDCKGTATNHLSAAVDCKGVTADHLGATVDHPGVAINRPGATGDRQGAATDRKGVVADHPDAIANHQVAADLAVPRPKKALATRYVDHGGHRSRRMDLHGCRTVGTNCHDLWQ
jgi:hypothetical protein